MPAAAVIPDGFRSRQTGRERGGLFPPICQHGDGRSHLQGTAHRTQAVHAAAACRKSLTRCRRSRPGSPIRYSQDLECKILA